MRAAAFSWAYSEQFEIGPLSEASIGATQAFSPQQGFADHVATPAIGLGWMIAEDWMDPYVIRRVEAHTRNPFTRILVRGGLNPSRSMANMLAGNVPWHRETRAGVWKFSPGAISPAPAIRAPQDLPPLPALAPFEFLATTRVRAYIGSHARGACIGGAGTAAYRVAAHWQIAADVSGCKFTNLAANLSGDSLTYLIGPRFTAAPLKPWAAYLQVLFGGQTLTHEQMDPARRDEIQAIAAQQGRKLDFPEHALYTRNSEITGFTIAANAGIDAKLSSAIAIRVADLGYTRSWHSQLDGINCSNSLEFSSGLIVRFGTW